MIYKFFYVLGISLLASGSHSFQKPRANAHLINGHTLQISCDNRNAETVESKVYRIDVTNSTVRSMILKVTNADKECSVSTNLPTESVQCICLKGRGVVCNISDISLAHKNVQWTCTVIKNNKTFVISDAANVFPEKSSTISTTEPSLVIISKKVINVNSTQENETAEEITTVTDMDDDVLETFTATAITNTTSTSKEELIRDITIINSNDSFYGTFTILTAAGVVLLLAATLLICVYRKFQIRTEEISPPLANNVSSVRTTTQELLFEGITARQRSPSHHHEHIPMMEISTLADRFPLSNEEMIAEHLMEAEAEHGNVNYYYTITDSPDADVPVYQNVNLESEPQWSETVRYESLLPKRTDENTPYSSLANI